MNDLVDARISGPDFARAWLAARRQSLDAGERVREVFERVLLDVFYLLDDYAIDPSLRGPDDMTDEQLVEKVRDAVECLARLDG